MDGTHPPRECASGDGISCSEHPKEPATGGNSNVAAWPCRTGNCGGLQLAVACMFACRRFDTIRTLRPYPPCPPPLCKLRCVRWTWPLTSDLLCRGSAESLLRGAPPYLGRRCCPWPRWNRWPPFPPPPPPALGGLSRSEEHTLPQAALPGRCLPAKWVLLSNLLLSFFLLFGGPVCHVAVLCVRGT